MGIQVELCAQQYEHTTDVLFFQHLARSQDNPDYYNLLFGERILLDTLPRASSTERLQCALDTLHLIAARCARLRAVAVAAVATAKIAAAPR